MRFALLIKSDDKNEAGALPDEASLTRMGNFNDEMIAAGVVLEAEGLRPSSEGARVRFADKKFTVIDGPFSESKELVGGFWIIQTKSKEEALAWARRAPPSPRESRAPGVSC
jgi:hypothetical protein